GTSSVGKSFIADLSDSKVRAIRMMEHQSTHRRFRVHHEAFGQLDTDVFGLEKFPNAGLIFQRRAGGVAEAVAFALVAGLEPVDSFHLDGGNCLAPCRTPRMRTASPAMS